MITARIPVRTIQQRLVLALAATAVLIFTACDGPAPPPAQEALEQHDADQAAQQAAAAEQQLQHERRLRDLDRVRHDAEATELHAQFTVLRGVAIGLAFTVLAALVWLAIEVRRRRVLTVVLHTAINQGGDPRENSEFPRSSS